LLIPLFKLLVGLKSPKVKLFRTIFLNYVHPTGIHESLLRFEQAKAYEVCAGTLRMFEGSSAVWKVENDLSPVKLDERCSLALRYPEAS
jgi:hypothetical protein